MQTKKCVPATGWTIRKVIGGWGKSKKKFPQGRFNLKKYSYGFLPKNIYTQRRK